MSQLLKTRLRYSFSRAEVEYEQKQNQHLSSPCASTLISSSISVQNYLSLLRSIFLSTSTSYSPERRRLENFLWTASAAFIIYFGDFRSNLLTIIVADPRIRRLSFNIGILCGMLNLGIMLYIALSLRSVKKDEERVKIVAPGAVPVATLAGLATYILFSHALWPIWNVLTLPMLFTLFMAMVVLTPSVFSYLSIKIDVETLRGLYDQSVE